MSWHYAPAKKTVQYESGEEVEYGMIEVYDIDGKTAYTENFMAPSGESKKDLEADLKRMQVGLRENAVVNLDEV